jgi:hypothetical protein
MADSLVQVYYTKRAEFSQRIATEVQDSQN